jgi:pyridoxine kinase
MKQILLINDVVGYSHVGMVAMLPILTYLGHPTYNLPTALVSNTLDYGKFNVLETTEYMRGTIPVWKQPTGAQDAYMTGDKVRYPDEQGEVWVSTVDNNVWEPGVYGWEKEE